MNRLLGVLFYVAVFLFSYPTSNIWGQEYPVPPIVYKGSSTFSTYACKSYSATVGKSDVTAAWDIYPGVTSFEVQLYNVERNSRFFLGTVTANEITFKLPIRTGHYVVEVRAVFPSGVKSQWAISSDINVATVDGVKKCWWIIGKPAAPGAININK